MSGTDYHTAGAQDDHGPKANEPLRDSFVRLAPRGPHAAWPEAPADAAPPPERITFLPPMNDETPPAQADAAPRPTAPASLPPPRRSRASTIPPAVRTSTMAQQTLEEPAQIATVVQAAVGHRSRGVVRRPGVQPLVVQAVALDEPTGGVVWESAAPPPAPPFFIELEGYNSLYHLPVVSLEDRPGGFVAPRPPWIVRQRARAHRRVIAPDGYEVEFEHPLTGTTVRRPVRDVSCHGLGFWTVAREDQLFLGMRVLGMRLLVDGEAQATFAGEVQGLPTGGDGERCGLRVETEPGPEAVRWLEAIDRVLYPATQRGGENYRALWDLYERSGYFRLSGKSPAWFEARRESFFSAAARLERAPELGCHAVWSSGEQAEAVVSALRIYSGTWFASQMAKTPGRVIAGVPRRLVLRDIQLHAYEHAYQDPSCRWLLTYVHQHARFNMLMCKDFTQRYHGSAHGWVSEAHALEVSCAEAPRREHAADIDVGLAMPDEVARVLEWIARACPAPYLDALDLAAERFDLAEFKAACTRAGFVRDRCVLVARRGGALVAAAVLDTATDGLHLFGLLDTARLFAAEPDAEPACYALLEGARAFYRAHGKGHFVAMCDGPWSPRLAPRDGMLDLGEANLTILAAERMPEWFEYMHQHLAPHDV